MYGEIDAPAPDPTLNPALSDRLDRYRWFFLLAVDKRVQRGNHLSSGGIHDCLHLHFTIKIDITPSVRSPNVVPDNDRAGALREA